MNTLNSWPVLLRLASVAIPLLFAVGALLASRDRPFASARRVSWGAVALSVPVALLGPLAAPGALSELVRLDVVTSAMLLLVSGLSVVIVRYSDTYLRGDDGRLRYVRALLLTLAAVATLVLTENLFVLALAWTGSSLALHLLLTHFPDRLQARVAAHKKFLLSRTADVAVLLATGLVYLSVGSVQLGAIEAFVASEPLPSMLQAAALLVAAAVTLKTAQLPFHGWLTQVMEAPTPVSALLHAGVVNIGGFVLIRLASLMTAAPVASSLLVVVGTVTAVTASLIMTTWVSVKVNLAWSTAAQMGLMLVQCGLGLWHLALLHLLAHSVYKAHAFLSAGSTVDVWRVKVASPKREPVAAWGPLVTAALTVPLTLAATTAVADAAGAHHGGLGPLSFLLGLALAPMLARAAAGGVHTLVDAVGDAAGIVGLYLLWHIGFDLLSLGPAPGAFVTTVGWALVVPAFVALFIVQVLLAAYPQGRMARTLQPHLFAGFYLDALFTRMTFVVWPPRIPPRPPLQLPELTPETQVS